MSREPGTPKLKFPLWQYLNQPLFSPEFKSLNPFRFWKLYNLQQLEIAWARSLPSDLEEVVETMDFLETCWTYSEWEAEFRQDAESVRFLERCWLISTRKSQQYFEPSEFPLDEEESY